MMNFRPLFNRKSGYERVNRGNGIAPGVGIGDAFHLEREPVVDLPVRAISAAQLPAERKRIICAVEEIKHDLEKTIEDIEQRFDTHTAGIFRAQRAIIDDPWIREEIESVLRDSLVNGEEVVKRVFGKAGQRLRDAGNDIAASRADEVNDLGRRIGLWMAGRRATHKKQIPSGVVLVTDEFYPSDTSLLPRNGVAAIIVTRGSAGSHVALLAKEMGIPVIAGVDDILKAVPEGHRTIADGSSGVLIVDPGHRTITRFRRRLGRGRRVQLKERWLRRKPVATRDGRRIEIYANVGSLDEAQHARQYGAEGIGLFRLEKIYLAESSPPSEEELIQRVGMAIQPLRGKPINIRLLDIGGDKMLPYVDLPEEANPFLGRRGIRLLFDFSALLRTQLRALLRVHRDCPIQILVPMVTVPEDIVRVREILMELSRELGIACPPKIGAMIEVPSAAICAAEIAGVSDFLSIGTNDLAQYAMAADRSNPLVADYYRPNHPAVFRLVRMVVEQTKDTTLSVCGDVASDLGALPDLLATGIRRISVVPSMIADVKDKIRSLDKG